MSRSLGDLGTPHEPVDLTFNYFGVVIRVNPNASDLDLVGFMLEAADVEAVDENKAMQATARYLKGLVHEDDWATFWSSAKGNRQTLPDLLMLGEKIVEAVSGTPFESSSDSANGQTSTGSKLKDDSSSPATPRKTARGGRKRSSDPQAQSAADVRRALALVPPGRADLKEFIILAHEARAAAQDDPGTETTAQRMQLVV